MRCDRGDFAEYWALLRDGRARRGPTPSRGRRRDVESDVRAALVRAAARRRRAGARRPAAAAWPWSWRSGRAAHRSCRRTGGSSARRPTDFEEPPTRLAHAGPAACRERSQRPLPPRPRRAARHARAAAAGADGRAAARPAGPRRAPRRWSARRDEHPCHACPDRAKHEHWAERASKLEREMAGAGPPHPVADRDPRQAVRPRRGAYWRSSATSTTSRSPKGRAAAADLRGGRHPRGRGHRRTGCSTRLSPSEAGGLASVVLYESRDRVPRRHRAPDARAPSPAPRDGGPLAARPAGRGVAPGGAVPRARRRVRLDDLRLGGGQAAGGRPGRVGDGAGRLRADDASRSSTCCARFGRSPPARRRRRPPRRRTPSTAASSRTRGSRAMGIEERPERPVPQSPPEGTPTLIVRPRDGRGRVGRELPEIVAIPSLQRRPADRGRGTATGRRDTAGARRRWARGFAIWSRSGATRSPARWSPR